MTTAPAATGHATLIDTIWPAAGNRVVRLVVLALIGTALLTLAAKIKVPYYPVPITMQTLVVLILGMAYGARLGAATVLLYLVEGAAGLPVFTGTPERGIGLPYMLGPTGGYLVGFVLAAGVGGYLAERGWDRSAFRTAVAMMIGNIVIYIPGAVWLGTVLDSADKAITLGVLPFLYGDALKLAIAVIALPLAWRLVQRVRG
ncbi:MAG: biotin transporter BioY [Alphaproteobacteria bacterium]|nr:biotin transporter BioY [Alphaproteobacteria bacterium]